MTWDKYSKSTCVEPHEGEEMDTDGAYKTSKLRLKIWGRFSREQEAYMKREET